MDPDAIDGVGRVPHGSSDDPDLLDFSANTNPLLPPGVEGVHRDALQRSRTYPPDDYPAYRRAAAAYVDCDPGHVVPAPGGLAAIRATVGATVRPGESVLVPYPSFGEYDREVRLQGGEPAYIPYGGILEEDPSGHALAIVCNPNNPTGEAYDGERLRDFADRCRDSGTTLLADEAFLGFTGRDSLAGRPGVVVARSLTKIFGLPGLRAGFAVATGETGERLRIARRAWNLGTPAAAVGAHCMEQEEFVAETRERVDRERERMRERLAERFTVGRSDAPYLLLDVGDRDPEGIVRAARERGVAVRDATTFRGLDSHVRVAVRLPGENDRLLDVLADV